MSGLGRLARAATATILALGVTGCAAVESQTMTRSGPTVSSGRDMQSRDFARAQYRGFNVNDAQTDQSYQDLAATGANLIRVPVSLHLACKQCVRFTVDPTTWQQFQVAVRNARKDGLKILLVAAPQPGGFGSLYWTNPAMQDSIAAFWTNVARAYRGDGVIAGFDLINEPVPHMTSIADDEHAWAHLAKKLVRAIRSADPRRMIVVEPAGFREPVTDFKPLPFHNIVYSVHFYYPMYVTHQGIYGNPAHVPYPSATVNQRSLEQAFAPVVQWQARWNKPVYVGEFSIATWAPGNSRVHWLRDVTNIMDRRGWNWTYHVWRSYPGWDAEIPGGTPERVALEPLPQRTELRNDNTPAFTLLRSLFVGNEQAHPHASGGH